MSRLWACAMLLISIFLSHNQKSREHGNWFYFQISFCSKTFFRRTIVSEQTFICQYSGNCDVNKSEWTSLEKFDRPFESCVSEKFLMISGQLLLRYAALSAFSTVYSILFFLQTSDVLVVTAASTSAYLLVWTQKVRVVTKISQSRNAATKYSIKLGGSDS